MLRGRRDTSRVTLHTFIPGTNWHGSVLWLVLLAVCLILPAAASATSADEVFAAGEQSAAGSAEEQAAAQPADDPAEEPASEPVVEPVEFAPVTESSVVLPPETEAVEQYAVPPTGVEWMPLSITVSELCLPTDIDEMINYLAEGYFQPDPEMTIEEALATAVTYNHDLNSRRLAAAAACQGIDVQWADLLPQLSLSAKGYWTDNDASSEPITIPIEGQDPVVIDLSGGAQRDFHQQLALSLTQRIYDFGLTNDLIDVAESQHAIKKYTVDMTEQQLVYNVITAYYQFNLALGQARVRDDELKLSRELLRQAEIQYEVGVVPRLDVIRAESRVEQARSNFIAAQSQVGDAAAYFYSLLGVEDQRYVPGVIHAALTEIGPAPVDVNTAIDLALYYRPELALQYAALDAGSAAKNLTRNRPILNAYANAAYMDPANSTVHESYEYGLQFMWNLYTGGSDRAKLKQEELNMKSITESLYHLESQIELDATTAWNKVIAARSSADAARKTLELASEAHRAAAVGYSAGVTPYIDYLNALDQNVAAALGYLFALADVKIAQTNLSRAMGFPFGYSGDCRADSPGDVDIYTTLGLDDHSFLVGE
ncbi:TolC family protein [bacterium]|nr:TolC family protein [bacterium]